MPGTASDAWDEIRVAADAVFERSDAVGGAVGLVMDGQTFSAGLGVTNVEHPLDVTTDTLFQIGSITKTIAATVVMRLVEQGKLDLDAPIRDYAPEFRVSDREASERATLRHVLTHTGGWTGDFFADTGDGDDAAERYLARMADLEQLAPLGAVYSYNNAGFYLAGLVIERVTGDPFDVVARALVLVPLGTREAHFRPQDVMTRRFAAGHTAGDDGPAVARPWALPRAAWPAGGLVCGIDDLLRLGRFAIGDGATEDGGRVLDPASMALMRAPQAAIRTGASCGLAWHAREVDGVTLVEHSGGTNGQYAVLSVAPERGFVYASLANSPAAVDKLHKMALARVLGVAAEEPTAIDSDVDELAAFEGVYSREPASMVVRLVGSRLVAVVTSHWGFPDKDKPPADPYPPFHLARCAADRLIITDGTAKGRAMDVVRGNGGAIRWIRHGGRLYEKTE